LEPIRLCYLNDKLGLDAEEARRNSPLPNLPARAAKLIIAYGSDERPELKRQSNEFAAAWSGRGLPGEIIAVAGCAVGRPKDGSNSVCRCRRTQAKASSLSATPRRARPCEWPRLRSAVYWVRHLGSRWVATRAQ